MAAFTWSPPWDNISLDEKIARTRETLAVYAKYSGPTITALAAEQERLLQQLLEEKNGTQVREESGQDIG